jgi:hypothetical protein
MTETSPAASPSTVSKGDTSVSESVAATEISDCSLDVMASAGTPFSKMLSCCLPQASVEIDEEEEPDEVEEVAKVDEPVVENTREIELDEEPVPEARTMFTIGKAVMSVAVVGAAVGAVVANGLV